MWDGVDRRKGSDWIDVLINVFNIAAWFIFLVALIIFHYAKPEVEYFVYNMISEPVEVRKHWIVELKNWLYVTLYFCITVSLITLVVNRFRLKRKTDQLRYGLIMLTIVCIAFVAVLSFG